MTSEFLRLWESEKESSGLAIFPLHVIIFREGGGQQDDGFGSRGNSADNDVRVRQRRRRGRNDAIAVASMRRASSHFPKPNGTRNRRGEGEKETGNGAKERKELKCGAKKATGGRGGLLVARGSPKTNQISGPVQNRTPHHHRPLSIVAVSFTQLIPMTQMCLICGGGESGAAVLTPHLLTFPNCP